MFSLSTFVLAQALAAPPTPTFPTSWTSKETEVIAIAQGTTSGALLDARPASENCFFKIRLKFQIANQYPPRYLRPGQLDVRSNCSK